MAGREKVHSRIVGCIHITKIFVNKAWFALFTHACNFVIC